MTQPQQTEKSTSGRRSGRADVVSGLIVAPAGLVLLLTALRIEEPARATPGIGPGTLPTALSVLLIVSGVVLAILGLRKRLVGGIEIDVMRSDDAEAVDELVFPEEPPVPLGRLLMMIGLFIGYALVFIPLGYMLSTALYLGVMVTVIDRGKWKRNLIFAAVFAAVVYYSFTELLSVALPAGILG